MDPEPPEGRILGLRENDGVLDGDSSLVVVAIDHPSLDLSLRAPALVHRHVKRVLVVVAVRTLCPDAIDQLIGAQDRQLAHSDSSMPSCATRQPAARTARCSGDPSRKMGFELLMCVKILCLTSARESCAKLPPAPPI